MARTPPFLAALAALALAAGAAAQHAGHDHDRGGSGTQAGAASVPHGPYAGMQTRTIKALSAAQVADLRAGRGMSLALPAELNGYPGPAHALELADALSLDDGQRARTQRLFEDMSREAAALGEQVVAAEAALDRLFRDRSATDTSVQAASAEAARLQGLLRATHLRYHLRMMETLTAMQIAQYQQLRGY